MDSQVFSRLLPKLLRSGLASDLPSATSCAATQPVGHYRMRIHCDSVNNLRKTCKLLSIVGSFIDRMLALFHRHKFDVHRCVRLDLLACRSELTRIVIDLKHDQAVGVLVGCDQVRAGRIDLKTARRLPLR